MPTPSREIIQYVEPNIISIINLTETTVSQYCQELNGDIKIIGHSCGQRYLVGGDWNARHWLWGDTYNSLRGRELAVVNLARGAYILATGSPTRYPHVPSHRRTCINFALYHGINLDRTSICENWDLDTDHVLVLVATLQQKVLILGQAFS